MSLNNRLCLFRLAILFMLAMPGLALGQANELLNPGFTMDLSGWEKNQSRPGEWSPEDANDSAGSGSALLAHDTMGTGGTPVVLSQCVPAQPDTEYSTGGDFLVPEGQPSGSGTDMFVYAYDSADCSGDWTTRVELYETDQSAWQSGTRMFTTGPSTQAILVTLGIYKFPDEELDATGHFDNVFLRKGVLADFVIEPAMATVWFNPNQSGHGVMVHLLDAGLAWACWFNFDLDGNRSWVCGLGSIVANSLVFDNAFVVEGGLFPPLFDQDLIQEVPWGSIEIEFSGCDAGVMNWNTTQPGYQSGSMPLVRAADAWGLECAQ